MSEKKLNQNSKSASYEVSAKSAVQKLKEKMMSKQLKFRRTLYIIMFKTKLFLWQSQVTVLIVQLNL